MQNFPNSPAPPPGFPSRGGNMVSSLYPPHVSEPQISPRTTEDYGALQSHSQHLHMRAQHPVQVPHIHGYGSRRGTGEIHHSGNSSSSYRKESMDYYFSVSGRDRNRRGGGAYGAGFGYSNMDGPIPHQYRHVSGSGSSSGLMSAYPMDYSASASSSNSAAASFSPSQQFSVSAVPPASGADVHQHQASQKYPSHQGHHQGHRTYSLPGHRIPSQFGHYPSLNAPTASAGMYNSPPQRYDTSSTGSMDSKINNSPTQSNPNSSTGSATSNNSGHHENVTQNYPSSSHPPYSPQSHPAHKHASRRTSQHSLGAGYDGYDASLKMQHVPPGHAHPKNPQSSVSLSPTTPLHSSQDISRSPMHSQNQQTHVSQNFSPVSNPSPAPSVIHSPSYSSSSSPLTGVSEGNTAPPSCPSVQAPSQSSLLHPRGCRSHARPSQTMTQLSPTPSSNSSISSCGSSAGSKATGMNANALNQHRMGVGCRGGQREEGTSSLYPQDKISQDPGLNSLNALTSQVANLPNTVQHMQLTDTVLSQKKSKDSSHQPNSQHSAANQLKPRNTSIAGHSSANEDSGDILGSKPEEVRKDHTNQSELEKVRPTGGAGTEVKPASCYSAPQSQIHQEQSRPGLHVHVKSRVTEASEPSPDAPACPPSSALLISRSSPTQHTRPNYTAELDHSHSDDRSGLKNKNNPDIKDERNTVEPEELPNQEPDQGKHIQNIVSVKVEHSSPTKQNNSDKNENKSNTQHFSRKTLSSPEQSNVGVIGVIVSARSEQNPEATKHTEAMSPHCAANYHLGKLGYSDEKHSINMFRDSGSHNGNGDTSVETYTAPYDVSPKIELGQSVSSNHCHLGPYKYGTSEMPYNTCTGVKNKGRAGVVGPRYQDYHHTQSNFGSGARKDAGVLAVGGRSGIGPRGQESHSQLQQPYPSLLQEVLQGYHLDRRYGRSEQASTVHHQPQNMSQPHYHTRLPYRMIESIRSHGMSQSVMGGASIHPQMALGKPHTHSQSQEAEHEMVLGLLHPPWDSEAQKPKVDHGMSLEKGTTVSPSNAALLQQCSDASAGPAKHINLSDYSLAQRKVPSLASPSAIQQLLLQEDSLAASAESISHTPNPQNSSSSERRSVICDVSPSRRNTPERERGQCATIGPSVIQQSLSSSGPKEQKCNKENVNDKKEQETGDASKVKHTTDGQSSMPAKEEPSKSQHGPMDLNSELNRHNSGKGNDTASNPLYHSHQHHLSSNPLSSPPRCKPYTQTDTSFAAYGFGDTVEESKMNTHHPFHTLTSPSHVPPPANKLQTYTHPLSLQHPHTMEDRFDWPANTTRPKDITIHYNSIQNSDQKFKIQSPSDVLPNQHHLPRQHSYPGSHYDMKLWESYAEKERAGNQHLRSTVPCESGGTQPAPVSAPKTLEVETSQEITEESAKAFHPAAAASATGPGGPNSSNTAPGIHQGNRPTKPGGSSETNPLMMRRRVRSFISPIPAKRLHQDFPSHRGGPPYHSPVSQSESRHLNESDSVNVDPCPKLSSPSTPYPTPSANSPPHGKTKILPPRRGRGLKLEAIVQKITPNKKLSYSNSHIDADFPDISHYSSDIPDPEIGVTFSTTPHREGGCLPYLDESHSLDDLLPYRAEDAYSCDSQVLKQSMTGSTSSTLRNLPTDFDFGLGTAVSSGPGTSEADKDDFTLLGPLPPPPPLPRPVQGSPPPSSSVLSDIQQFTNTYQQLETRRGEQSAANLLRQKLQETGIGFDDYGGDFYGAAPHSQSPGHHLLSRPPQHQLTSARMADCKPPDSIVPKGYFPSGKKKGRPVGSVNKQKRVQVHVQPAMANAPAAPPHSPPPPPHSPPPPPPHAVAPAAAPHTTPNSSTTEEAVTASVLPDQKTCPSLDLAIQTQPIKVDVESEDNQPEADIKPVKHRQRKGKEGSEETGSRGRQWRRRRGLAPKEDLDPPTGSGGNAGMSGTLQDTRKKVFSPYIHVERKIAEIGAVCTIVNSEDEKSKGKVTGFGEDGPSAVVLASQMIRKEKEIERLQEKGNVEQSESAMQSGKLLPTSGYVLLGPVISETGHTGRFLCCLCQKWANYKNLGDLYGPFYPAEYAAKFPKNQPQIRQILSHSGAANTGSNLSSISAELTASDTLHPPNIKSVDSDCIVSQTTTLVSPATSVGMASPPAGEDLPCQSAKMSSSPPAQNWDPMPDVASVTLKPPDLEIEITQKQKPEDPQQRPQHRKLTSHPRFKRRHKSGDGLPRTIPINSKASLPFQPPPPSLDALGPQLAQLPLVPLDPSELWVHESCIVWTSGVYLVNGRLYGLQEALDGAREMNCSHCEMAGSTLGCYSKGCTLRFHHPCAVEAECYLNEDNFSLRCPKHKLTSRPAKPAVAYQEQSERG
ncbi:transcription factor 20 isoform X2 [Brachyhypopomus gauderio]|uniref:transcription factor 20 isoform X2 n=1 Tax=Brachyhypopomus gauderio TaxID=698409 RepID=UPI0040412E70